MADALDLLRARLSAPGPRNPLDLAAMEAAVERIEDLERLGEAASIEADMARVELARFQEGGTVEWGVRYEFPFGGGWARVETVRCGSEYHARQEADERKVCSRYRNVEVVARRRYVTDWQPVEPQP